MAAEAEIKVWVEGSEKSEVINKVVDKEEPLVESESASDTTTGVSNGSVGTGESLSVISDTLSEEYSSDSGKGGSDTTVTPPGSINDTETVATPWPLCGPYGAITAYSKSLGAVMPNHAMIYEFEMPQVFVGRLIGRLGIVVNKIKAATGTNIFIKRHHQNDKLKICAIQGICSEIEQALQMIRDQFPIKHYRSLTLEQINLQSQVVPASNISFIPNNRLNLIEGVVNDVSICSVIDLDHIFVQQPTHPTFPALSRLHQALNSLYQQPKGAPQLVRPFNPGVICVTKIGNDDWVRAEVVAIDEEKEQVTAKLVDVGGYIQVPIEVLRQIRVDFVTIPFQSTECRMANIAPVNEKEGWTEEAVNFFRIMCQGHVLQANVVGYCSRTGTTLINLYKPNGSDNHILINEEMVNHNCAKWVDELDQQYYYTEGVDPYSSEIDQLSQNFGEWVHISPADMMTGMPTEGIVDYNSVAPEFVPAGYEGDSQLPTDVNDNACNYETTFDSTLSWAEEMSSHDLEAGNNIEDLTVSGEDENTRRKKGS